MSDSYTTVKIDDVLKLCESAKLHCDEFEEAQNDKKIYDHIEDNHQPKTRWIKWYKRETYMPDRISREQAIERLDEIYEEYWRSEWRNNSCRVEREHIQHIERLCEASITGEITISSTHNNTLKARYTIWKAPE